MNVRRESAMLLGLVAAVVMSLVMVVVRTAELSNMNLEMMNGAMLTGSVGLLTWLVGFALHLVTGGALALVYAFIFECWGGAGWLRGLVVAVPHALLSGLLLAVLPYMHPAIPEHGALRAPGFLGVEYGVVTLTGFILMHLLFGIIVGGGYRVREPARRAAMSHGPP